MRMSVGVEGWIWAIQEAESGVVFDVVGGCFF
jgi:hypothetical protein